MAGAWPGMAGAWPERGQSVAGAWPGHGQGVAGAWPGPTTPDTTRMARHGQNSQNGQDTHMAWPELLRCFQRGYNSGEGGVLVCRMQGTHYIKIIGGAVRC